MKLNNKKIILGVTGGIAAYKAASLVRLLQKSGAEVRVVMTEAAKNFITPLTLETLSGHVVYCNMFQSREAPATQHISLARWADAIIIAPATANIIAKIANGVADNLLLTICLSTEAEMIIAPAMNQAMWRHPATQENIKKIESRGCRIVGPAEGEQACGEVGHGRMVEPEELVLQLTQSQILSGKKVLITAGPTHEAIDPVRFIGNYSSGKMGFSLARAAREAGAEVVLIAGPVGLSTPVGVKRVDIVSAREMHEAVISNIDDVDIFIAAAAVADYGVSEPLAHKIKRQAETLQLSLSKNPDILLSVAQLQKRPLIVGFAAESENLIENAKKKLKSKQADMIVANLINQVEYGFNSDFNNIVIVSQNDEFRLGFKPKNELAKEIVCFIVNRLN